MAAIEVVHNASDQELARRGVQSWPIWTKEVAAFPYHYDEQEVCYFLAGRVVVTPAGGQPVQLGVGDLVTFPAGLDCQWDIQQPVRKHYRFG